ncbi:MAG: hypothetical protein KDE63_03955 [Novosphingobium sp.]|nr:hypothetical protein [Novosphingobium sp.]
MVVQIAAPAHANEAAGHTYPTITIPAGTASGSLNEYSRIGATVTFEKTPNISDFASCSGSITCKNLVPSTAQISMSCDGDESLKGGWDSEVLTGDCWSSIDACYYEGTINEDCPPLDPDAKKAVNNDYQISGYSNCSSGDKGMCAYENTGAKQFSTVTGDHMFKIQDGASAFLDYRALGTATDTPYKLRWVHRNGGDASRALMIPSGPFVSTGGLTPYADYRRFMANPPSFVTTTKSCFPVEVSFCEGDFAAPPKRPQNGACGTLAGTYMGSAPANNLPETTTQKCLKGMDTPVTTNTSYEPSAPNRYEWQCQGLDGGADASCFAYLPWNGQCGSANGSNSYNQPTSNLCYKGDVTAVSVNNATHQWEWQCNGRPGASLSTDASCSANIIIDGSCGSAAGADFTSAPSGPNLCEYGNPTSVTQDTCSWKWTCNGIHGGTNMACQANRVQLCTNVGVYATWRYYGTKNNYTIYSGPGGRMLDNCPSGYTATELADDADSSHSLGEDNYKGGDRSQLCIGTGNSQVSVTSEWNLGGCSAGMTHTGVFDSNDTNTDADSKRYRYKHNVNEEDNTADQVYWCLGLNDPSNRFDLSISNPYSGYCPSGETLLVNAHGTEWNVNNEDGSDNRSVCLKITPKPGATCPVCAGGCGSANGIATSTTPGGGALCSSGTASAVSATSDTYLWSCTASGVTSNCSAPKVSAGICGAATSIESSTAPTDDLCALGNDSPVIDDVVEWSWTCAGLNGGATVSCTAPKPACGPLDGECGSNGGTCTAGTISNDNGASACGTTRTWKCLGENGGSTANCSKANAACAPTGTCKTYSGSHITQPASNTATGCTDGAYSDLSDTSSAFRWRCGTVTCTVVKANLCGYGNTAYMVGRKPMGCYDSRATYSNGSDTSTSYKWSCSAGSVVDECGTKKMVSGHYCKVYTAPPSTTPLTITTGCAAGATAFTWKGSNGSGTIGWECTRPDGTVDRCAAPNGSAKFW